MQVATENMSCEASTLHRPVQEQLQHPVDVDSDKMSKLYHLWIGNVCCFMHRCRGVHKEDNMILQGLKPLQQLNITSARCSLGDDLYKARSQHAPPGCQARPLQTHLQEHRNPTCLPAMLGNRLVQTVSGTLAVATPRDFLLYRDILTMQATISASSRLGLLQAPCIAPCSRRTISLQAAARQAEETQVRA